MPFDGTSNTDNDCITVINNMIDSFDTPFSWRAGKLYSGDPKNPEQMCILGALNYATFGCAKPYRFKFRHQNGKLWKQVDKAMHEVAKENYNTTSYVGINDDIFRSRFDAVEFLCEVRSLLYLKAYQKDLQLV